MKTMGEHMFPQVDQVDVGGGQAAPSMTAPSVVFVPLNLDMPLELQHGGRFNCIIHKLTEDILTLTSSTTSTDRYYSASRRVSVLESYAARNAFCKLIDPPSNVSLVMNRGTIASLLATSLQNQINDYTSVVTKVRTPAFVIVDTSVDTSADTSVDTCVEALERRVLNAGMRYPLIIKNLDAAGTAESHQMSIALTSSALKHVVGASCLIQEYENHDGHLFKCYVLGSTVRVYKRISLPNLPTKKDCGDDCDHGNYGDENYSDENYGNTVEFLRFDSQRPYPTINDFGVDEKWEGGGMASVVSDDTTDTTDTTTVKEEEEEWCDDVNSLNGSVDNYSIQGFGNLTLSDVTPIANTISKQFGLTLFGFDLLVHVNENGEREIVVVDVNYFPSYKEMKGEFKEHLEEYLVGKANEECL
jgi:inositol-1,3,4-trisphosphate 5/6-kinase/inositol-tetrakisphosphate 1-kinase